MIVMKTLVTGASGFIDSTIVRKLLKTGSVGEISGVKSPKLRLPYPVALALGHLFELGARITKKPPVVSASQVINPCPAGSPRFVAAASTSHNRISIYLLFFMAFTFNATSFQRSFSIRSALFCCRSDKYANSRFIFW